MFRRSSDPLALSEASLLALRPAMNAPVLNADFLPVGPARAAIVVFAEEYGGIGLAIGVRSNEGGQIAVFRNQEPLDASTSIADALEPALASAERMGFLFDEDLVESVPGGVGRSQAMKLWGQLMGELEATSASGVGPAPLDSDPLDGDSTLDDESTASSLAPPAPELILDDVAPVEPASADLEEISLDLEAAVVSAERPAPAPAAADVTEPIAEPPPPAPVAVPPPPAASLAKPVEAPAPVPAAPPPKPQLSRFRNAASPSANGAAASDVSDSAGSELGRIPLVRVRRDGSKRVPFLARLLSSF